MTIPNHYLWLYHDKTLLYMSKWVWEIQGWSKVCISGLETPANWIILRLTYFRLTLVLSCAMKFESYPHDIQVCSMMIESCKKTSNVFNLKLVWLWIFFSVSHCSWPRVHLEYDRSTGGQRWNRTSTTRYFKQLHNGLYDPLFNW